jgi:hypothetical protein
MKKCNAMVDRFLAGPSAMQLFSKCYQSVSFI